MGIARVKGSVKGSVKGRNAFRAVFLYEQYLKCRGRSYQHRTNLHIRQSAMLNGAKVQTSHLFYVKVQFLRQLY